MNMLKCALLTSLLLATSSLHGADLRTADGTLYEGYRIKGVEEDALRIFYAGGEARIAFTNLPPDIQKRWLPSETIDGPAPTLPPDGPVIESPPEGRNAAPPRVVQLGPHRAEVTRHYFRFYICEDQEQLFPIPLSVRLLIGDDAYTGQNGLFRFQREQLAYQLISDDPSIVGLDIRQRLILKKAGSANLQLTIDGQRTLVPLSVISLPIKPGMTEEEVLAVMGKPDTITAVSVDWPDDIRKDHIRYKGYLPAEEWQGIPSTAWHWRWDTFPGAVVSIALDNKGNKRFYQVSSSRSAQDSEK
jgi:hypothetical protein